MDFLRLSSDISGLACFQIIGPAPNASVLASAGTCPNPPPANVLSIPRPRSTQGAGDAPHRRESPSERTADSRTVLSDLAAGMDPDARALRNVQFLLRSHVARVFPELDADEIVQEVIVRLIQRRNIASTKIENPWGYLLAMARNAAIDAIRAGTRRRGAQLDHPSDQFSSEDEIAGLIDRDATHAALLAAFRVHIRAGDTSVVPIITAWLDTAEELARAPTTREVAARAGVSHTSVAQALVRFRATLEGRAGER
jgi:hypothetical protein